MKYKYAAVLEPVKNSESYYARGPNLPLSENYYNHNDGEWIDRNHIFCPVAQRILEIIDCMEINDVARRIQSHVYWNLFLLRFLGMKISEKYAKVANSTICK